MKIRNIYILLTFISLVFFCYNVNGQVLVEIPWQPTTQYNFSTNIYVTVEHAGDSRTLTVKPKQVPTYKFKSAPTHATSGDLILVGPPSISDFSAVYTFKIAGAKKQGMINVSGAIIPNSTGSGGGGGQPLETLFNIDHLMKVATLIFKKPAETNLVVASGSTNMIRTKLFLGNGSPSMGNVQFTLAPTSLGDFTSNNVALAAGGIANTGFIATTNGIGASGLMGLMTATASGIVDQQTGVALPPGFTVSTNVNVIIPKIKMEFLQKFASPVVSNYITNDYTIPDNKTNLELRCDILLSTVPIATNLHLGRFTTTRNTSNILDEFHPQQGATVDPTGTLNIILFTHAKTPTLNVVVASQQSDPPPHNMLPAYYMRKFFTTVYYTPIESGFTNSSLGFITNYVSRQGLGGQRFPADFLRSVGTEGFGRIDPPRAVGNYVYNDGTNWGFASQAVGNSPTRILQPKHSCAVARKGGNSGTSERTIPDGGGANITQIDIEAASVAGPFGNQVFRVVDVGGKLQSSQIDLYWGEDLPFGPGGGVYRPAGTPYTGSTQLDVILNTY